MTDKPTGETNREADRLGSEGSSPSGVVGQSPAYLFASRETDAEINRTVSVFPHGDGRFEVRDGGVVHGVFDSNRDAWRWIDRHQCEPISPAEKKTDWIVGHILGGSH